MEGKAPEKLDLKKKLRHLYLPSPREVTLVDVPEMKFIAVDGRIEPNATPGTSPAFADAIGALYGFAYTLKFMSKLRQVDPIDYTVMALEGLWTMPVAGTDYAASDEWSWTLMIMQPDHISQEMFAQALAELRKKRDQLERKRARAAGAGGAAAVKVASGAEVTAGGEGSAGATDPGGEGHTGSLPALDRVRLESFHEGLCVQIMHIGPYADEPRTVDKMAAFAGAQGYVFHGRHHEIYLGDPRTARPENLKTVLRHAVHPAG
jgi:hypothetical protein